ncbi:hypothetical protein BC6307_07160 [Sutcliffiella cohnii]|uniref:GmrSD restriction endonucleases N-terminal domain-containing protein n=1 Tax=Sutcliffiella cohnii TaxID=33932 RepID=A0A223KNK8_9BACI|nr:DUF262 domain-containing protein [Sutcliffiella cohnii]AST91071.1 hypothetical protein BC6307_07160 [Sutcliffiella cohnii]
MKQPENVNIKFGDLINQIDSGDIKIPQFQREFVWSKTKSAELLDSILKGYPIGSFTLWKTTERLRTIRNLGGANLPDAREDHPIDYVLDGQQRMTSLYASFKGLKINKNSNVEDFEEIYIDLTVEENGQLVITDVKDRKKEEVIKLKELLYGGRKLMRIYPESLDAKLEEYKNRFITYTFSGIILKNVPIDIATEVFSRLNVGGQPLSTFEIMVAKTYDETKNFDLSIKYDEFINRVEDVGYETISASTLLQLIAVLIKKECTRKHILSLSRDEFIKIWDSAIDALEHAIDYFKSYYRIPVSKLLPYNALLIPFAYFFYHHNDRPNNTQRRYLEDFFWRTSISERYSQSLEAKVAQDIKRIDKILEEKLPNYDYEVNIEPSDIIDNGWFSTGRSFIKAILCLFTYQEPKSFLDNSKVTLDNDWLKIATSKNYHHFFPKKFLEGKKEEFYINHIANITIVDDYLNKRKIKTKDPSIYMSEFQKANRDLENTMKTHLIDLDNFGIFTDDYDTFLNKRAEAISNELKKKIIKQSLSK